MQQLNVISKLVETTICYTSTRKCMEFAVTWISTGLRQIYNWYWSKKLFLLLHSFSSYSTTNI